MDWPAGAGNAVLNLLSPRGTALRLPIHGLADHLFTSRLRTYVSAEYCRMCRVPQGAGQTTRYVDEESEAHSRPT